MWPYANEKEALQDVLRLATAMTKKAAISGLQMGGGKAVIIGDSGTDKTRSLLCSMGEFIDSLHGKYIAAKDSGILPEDLDIVAEKTRHVTGTTDKHGGSGDPSMATAKGILAGMQSACKFVLGTKKLKGRVVAIQGVGQVGWNLGNLLAQQGAQTLCGRPPTFTSKESAAILEGYYCTIVEDPSDSGRHLCTLCPWRHIEC